VSEKWLISFRYAACFRYEGRISRNQPVDAVQIIDEHPAKFLAEARAEYHRLCDWDIPVDPSKQPPRADDIDIVYFAMPVPPDLLDEDEEDSLS